MKKGLLLITLLAILGIGYYSYTNTQSEPVDINEVGTMSIEEARDQGYETSQVVTDDNSIAAIESDLNNTVILEEDFSDVE